MAKEIQEVQLGAADLSAVGDEEDATSSRPEASGVERGQWGALVTRPYWPLTPAATFSQAY